LDGLGSRSASVANIQSARQTVMWEFQSNRNRLRERMLIAAPEANPHQFVQRVLLARGPSAKESTAKPGLQRDLARREETTIKSRFLSRVRVPAAQP